MKSTKPVRRWLRYASLGLVATGAIGWGAAARSSGHSPSQAAAQVVQLESGDALPFLAADASTGTCHEATGTSPLDTPALRIPDCCERGLDICSSLCCGPYTFSCATLQGGNCHWTCHCSICV
jgi:hypothetical protein